MRLLVHRAPLLLTALFAIALETLARATSIYWALFAACVAALVVATIVTLREDVHTRGLHVLILPVVYLGSVFLFNLFVPQVIFQQLFISFAAVGFFFLTARGVEWAFPTWNWFFTSVAFFLFVAGVYGLTFHLRFPAWASVGATGGMTFLLSLHVLCRAEIPGRQRVFWSVLLALIMSEFLSVFTLLPLSYLVVSGALFVAFYIALHLLQRYLYDRLTPRLIGEYLLLGVVAVSLVLGTAQWAVV